MIKPMRFIPSVMVTVLILIGGAALASILGETNQIRSASDEVIPSRGLHSLGQTGLSIELNGTRSSKGKLLLMVFDDANAFNSYDHKKAVGYQEAAARSEKINFNFPSLSDGPYAVLVIHDENDDYQLNEKDGYPIEGFVISGAKNKYDDPPFRQAAVAHGKYQLELVYF